MNLLEFDLVLGVALSEREARLEVNIGDGSNPCADRKAGTSGREATANIFLKHISGHGGDWPHLNLFCTLPFYFAERLSKIYWNKR